MTHSNNGVQPSNPQPEYYTMELRAGVFEIHFNLLKKMKDAKIETFGNIANLTFDELTGRLNSRRTTIEALTEKLRPMGLVFRDDTPDTIQKQHALGSAFYTSSYTPPGKRKSSLKGPDDQTQQADPYKERVEIEIIEKFQENTQLFDKTILEIVQENKLEAGTPLDVIAKNPEQYDCYLPVELISKPTDFWTKKGIDVGILNEQIKFLDVQVGEYEKTRDDLIKKEKEEQEKVEAAKRLEEYKNAALQRKNMLLEKVKPKP